MTPSGGDPTTASPAYWLGRINPVAQIVAILTLTVTALATVDLLTPAVLLAAELTLLPAAGLHRPRTLLARTWPLLLTAVGVAWVNLIFSVGEAWDWTGSAALALRVLAVALPGVLFVASTDAVRVADALTIHWRMSPRFAYGALAAIRLAPLMVTEWQAIRLARRARGVDAGGNPIAALRLLAGAAFTLLVGTIRRGSRLALAMDARGFNSSARPRERPDSATTPRAAARTKPTNTPGPDSAHTHHAARRTERTNARGSVLRPRDYLFIAATVMLCAATTAMSAATGLWHPVFAS